ncbi:hypothetical protein SAMN02745163_00830 [Clostridium cavendishii DSM 21758]|uniref:Uncharacterized protein n=1 Tax=Clostridium cavendishii DSM 21758 TaxID=1121302 RepID=A0A1M6EE14_9CLOT|nr:hypothetical protein [Clostridium cavendishii]SHI83673.1 hypothetical protein SAMN02745163_00830 [Clostridium cavendishii DSM 21758]
MISINMPVSKMDRINASYLMGFVNIVVFFITVFIVSYFTFKYKTGVYDFRNISFNLLKSTIEGGILLSVLNVIYIFTSIRINYNLGNGIIYFFVIVFSSYFNFKIDDGTSLILYGVLAGIGLILSYIISFKIFDRYSVVK